MERVARDRCLDAGFLPIVAVALLLTQPQSAPPPVGIEMRNVHLHVAADAALDVKWLKGWLRSTSVQPPVFDDQNSYTMEVDDGELSSRCGQA